MTTAERRKQVCVRATRAALYALLAIYIAILLATVETKECISDLKQWLSVYNVVQALHFLAYAVAALLWTNRCKVRDPSTAEAVLRIVFQVWLYLFEGVWVGRAISFTFSGQVAQCDERLIQISCIVLVFLGFLLWIRVICGTVGACYMLHRYRKKHRSDALKKQKLREKQQREDLEMGL